MLQVADRDFLIEVLKLPTNILVRGLQNAADKKLALELREMEPRLGTPAAREVAMKLAALKPPQGDTWLSITLAVDILAGEIRTLDADKPSLKRRPDPLHTARAGAAGDDD